MRSRLFSSDDRKRFSEQKANRELFERATQLLIRFGRYDEALKNIEASQSVEMFNSLNLEGVKTQDKEYAGLLDRLRELSRKMTLLDRDISGAEADEIQRREYLSRLLAGTRQEFFSVINEIKSRNPDFEQLISVRPLDLVAVQKAIPQDTILLEYYPSREKLYIFSISADTFSIKSVDVAQERLYSLVTDFRSSILGKNNSGSSKELAIKGSVLYSLLLAPVENELQGHAHIQIIPGGLLWYLPFEALRNGDRGYFLNEKTVGYLSSSDILGLIKGKENGTQNSGTLIAFGDPEGVSLPASREEVESLGKIWPESRIFSGRNATKEQFLKEAGQASYIHIASHSSLDRSNINSTCITFAGTDSRLTLGEIYGLALAKSPLVVLSSCDSALGEDNPGRELASLSSAFQTAGASSVIASLWKVEDTSTRVMFGEFYEALKKGESRADALRSAKMALLRRPATSHPFYWAGFILYGDWRR
jgi:CHAT domain-containing protein